MKLKEILNQVALISISGDPETEIQFITSDSRKVKNGSLFVALRGTQSDGHDFISMAIDQGAAAIVTEISFPINSIPIVVVKNTAESLGIISANFYDNPSKKLKVIGITGTNGKTTTVTLLHQLFTDLGYPVGMISTVENRILETRYSATHTTPDAITLQQLFHSMVENGCEYCFMEVSSHALVQYRVNGTQFSIALFTNITHDHLDFHHSFDDYIKAKKILFDILSPQAIAIVNKDDKRGLVMIQNTKATKRTFALHSPADYKGKILANSFTGLQVAINQVDAWFPLFGEFNAYNLLGVYAIACELGLSPEDIMVGLSKTPGAKGRLESIRNLKGVHALVDYAHTPDALENVLSTLTQFRTRQETLITVVGCGGNRDKSKRPLMANIACKYSDKIILTSDNPRNEEPEMILKEMMEGVPVSMAKNVMVVVDRKEAIKIASQLAHKNDIVLVAGKGHEDYQEIKGVKYPFSDQQLLKENLN